MDWILIASGSLLAIGLILNLVAYFLEKRYKKKMVDISKTKE